MDILHIIELLLLPITNVITWFATRNKRRNDAIAAMQGTIDMLVQKNGTMVQELIQARKEIAQANAKIAVLEANQIKLLSENSELKKLIEKKK